MNALHLLFPYFFPAALGQQTSPTHLQRKPSQAGIGGRCGLSSKRSCYLFGSQMIFGLSVYVCVCVCVCVREREREGKREGGREMERRKQRERFLIVLTFLCKLTFQQEWQNSSLCQQDVCYFRFRTKYSEVKLS